MILSRLLCGALAIGPAACFATASAPPDAELDGGLDAGVDAIDGAMDGGLACTNVLPPDSVCTSMLPSFDGSVHAVIEAHCAICHSPGGVEPSLPMTSYSEIKSRRASMLDQVFSCRMPPDSGMTVPLTPAETSEMIVWLYCGAPAN